MRRWFIDGGDVAGQYSSYGMVSSTWQRLGRYGETYRIVTEVNGGNMNGTSGSDLLVASDHQDGLTMSGGNGSNVLVGAAGQQNFIVGLGHDVIKNFDANDTITSESPIAKQGGDDYVRVDGDGNVSKWCMPSILLTVGLH